MKSKFNIRNSVFSLNYSKKLLRIFNKYWVEYINTEVKRKFLHKVYKHDNEIKQCRVFLGMPPEGFNKDKELIDWLIKKRQKKSPKYLKRSCIEERNDYKVMGLNLYSPKTIIIPIKNNKHKNNLITFDAYVLEVITDLARKIKLDMNWLIQLERYVFIPNEEMRAITDCGIKMSKIISRYPDGKPFDGKILLELGANTTFEDLKLVWKNQVKQLLKTFPSRIEIPTNYKPKKPSQKNLVKRKLIK